MGRQADERELAEVDHFQNVHLGIFLFIFYADFIGITGKYFAG